MGFQTNISILNDHFAWIEENPATFVRAIRDEMLDGTKSCVSKCLDERDLRTDEGREADRHYVTVHRTHHADIPQITYTHHNSSFDVYDITRGVELGYLDRVSNPDVHIEIYKNIAKELRRQARELDKAIKARNA